MKWIYEEFSIQYFYRWKERNIGEKSVGLLFLCQLFLKGSKWENEGRYVRQLPNYDFFTGFHSLYFSLKFFS